MHLIRSILVFLCIGCVVLPSTAQSLLDADDLRKRFERPAEIRWMHTYKGLWGNLHPITLLLAFDGHKYHGLSQDMDGRKLFDLEGYHQDTATMLQEIDADGRTSGYYVVTLHEGRMKGNWWSADFTRSASLSLKNETVVELRKFEPSGVFITGMLEEDIYDLILQREEADLITGFFTYQTGEEYYRVRGRCTDPSCDRMELSFFGSSGSLLEMSCLVQRGQAKVTLKDEHGEYKEGNGTISTKFPLEKLLHAEYIGNIDCLYPVLKVPAFDAWVENFALGWYAKMEARLDSLREAYDNSPGPAQRWSFQASAWIDMTLISPDFVSGIITWFEPGMSDYARDAFIFDVKAEKLIPLKEIGRKQGFAEDLLSDAAELKAPFSEDPAFTEWIAQAVLEHVVLAPDGFIVFTDFNPLFGDLWIKLRYEDYLNSMRRNALVQDKYK